MSSKKYSLDSYKEIPTELRREFLVNHNRDEQYIQQLLSRVLAEVVAGIRGFSGDPYLETHYQDLIEALVLGEGEIVFDQPKPAFAVYTATFTRGTNISGLTITDNGIGNPYQVNVSTVVPEPYNFKTVFGLEGLSFN